MDLKEAQRLRDLEKENAELKKLLADQLLKTKALEIALEKISEPGAAASDCPAGAFGAVVFQTIRAADVLAVLQDAIAEHGAPEHTRSDNGPEFIA